MTSKKFDGYTVEPFPKMRRFAIDAGRLGHRRHTVHGLVEMDVTEARQKIRELKKQTGEQLSFTAFIINCLATAVDENKAVHASINWRNQLVIFDDVNVNMMIEIEKNGRKVPIPHIIKAANRRSLQEIHNEIRATQAASGSSGESKFMSWFLPLPWFVRRFFYWLVTKNPHWLRDYQSTVMVTAVGMFGEGTAWGIPLANFPLTVTLGSIGAKPGVVGGRIEIREYLHLTLSFDHDIIDGAPAARFAQRFKELVEGCYGF